MLQSCKWPHTWQCCPLAYCRRWPTSCTCSTPGSLYRPEPWLKVKYSFICADIWEDLISLPILQSWTLFTIAVASSQHLQSPMSELAHPFNQTFLIYINLDVNYLPLLLLWSFSLLFCILSVLLTWMSSYWNCKKSWCWCHRMISCCRHSNPRCTK